MAQRRPAQPLATATALAARPRRPGRALLRLAPSRRSLVVGLALLAACAGAYAVARQSSLFAIRRIELVGAPPLAAAQVRRALAGYEHVSLVSLDGGALLRQVEAVPTVDAASYDRAFPHTLRVTLRPERAVAVLRRGRDSWLVSARGRVIAPLSRAGLPALPRIWVPHAERVEVGGTLPDDGGGVAARALAPLAHAPFPVRIETVSTRNGDLALKLASGTEIRLGRPQDLRLKLAIARRIVPGLPGRTPYLDVSVPERPVAGGNPQLSGSG